MQLTGLHSSQSKAIFSAGLTLTIALAGCDDEFASPLLSQADRTAVLTVLSPEGPSLASAGESLPEPLIVKATTENGRPILGQPIHFEVVTGGGTVSIEDAATDWSGLAESEWTLGNTVGWQELAITSGDASDSGGSATAAYRVRAIPPGPYTLRASPSIVELTSTGREEERTAWVAAEVRNGNGELIPDVPISWTSTATDIVTISDEGVAEGISEGESYAVATFLDAADSVHVKVNLSGNTGSGAALHPNEPAGFTSISERAFDAREENGWRATSNSRFSVTSDQSGPASSPSVGEIHYPAGWGAGSSPAWTEHGVSGRGMTSVYVSFWLKVSDNWQGHPVNNKIAYLWTHGKPVVFPVYIGGGSDPLATEIRIQDVPDGARNFRPNVGNVAIERGEWHHWEVLLVSNSDNASNGEIHWWIDGAATGSYTDVRFGTASQSKVWETIAWRPVWGGAGGQVQQDMYMWMDHFYVSGAR